jgi:molybdate transport system substrate-binding protein
MMRHLFSIVLVALALSSSAAEVRVFAAVSLTEALEEIASAHERATGDEVVFHFGASSLLARQIEQGAPADLFLSADDARMDALAKRELIVDGTRASVLSNALVVVVPRDSGKKIVRPEQLVNVESIALAEPSSVPAGVYAREWLQKIGLWERIRPKVIPTDNVRAALAAVESGNVEAAIVYRTDARIAKHTRVAFEVPRAQGPAISYPFALLRDAENREAALRLLTFLRSKAALKIFAKHGFDISEVRAQSTAGRGSIHSGRIARDVASPIWSAAAAAAAFVCHGQRSNIQKRQLRLPHSKPLPRSRITGNSSRPEKTQSA